MRSFANAYPDYEIVQQAAGLIPWFPNCVILDKIKEPIDREFYIRKTIENGWSRNILAMQIDSGLHLRQGRSAIEAMENRSQLIIYQTEASETKLEVRLENETVWLTQKLMAELFRPRFRTSVSPQECF